MACQQSVFEFEHANRSQTQRSLVAILLLYMVGMVSSKSEPAGVVEEAGKTVKPTAKQKVTRSPSLAKPDYGVYHTK